MLTPTAIAHFCPGILHNIFKKSDTSSTYVHRDIGNFASVIAILEIEKKVTMCIVNFVTARRF